MARTPILAREEASHVLKKYLAEWGRKRKEVSDHASQVVNPLDLFGFSLLVILSLHMIPPFTQLAKATSPLLEGGKVKHMASLSETERHLRIN